MKDYKKEIKMIFSTIKIKNKEVYLMTDIETGQFSWTENKSDCIIFNEERKAQSFAKKYFKEFENWEVVDIEIQYA